MHVTTLVATALALVGGIAIVRWLPGRARPNIEELVAAEVAAAERELSRRELSRRELSQRELSDSER